MVCREVEIIFICEHEFPDGGAQSVRINNMVKGISEIVKVITIYPKSYVNEEKLECNKNIIIKEVIDNKKNKKNKFLNKNFYSIKVFNSLLKYKSKQEQTYIYLSTASPLTLMLISLICRLKGYKLIIDIGEWFPFSFKNTSSKLYSYVRHVIYRWLSKKLSNYIVAISEYIQKKCRNSKASVIVIPAIVSYLEINKITDKRKLNLFYPGTLKKEDGFSNLLIALYKLNNDGLDIKLLTSGSFTEVAIIECCDSIGIPLSFAKQKIRHMGWLSNKEYINLLQSSSLIILPRPLEFASNIASFPTRLAESISLAATVAISNVGDIELYLRPNVDFLNLKSGTSLEIYTTLKYWMNNQSEFESIGLNGYNFSKKYLDAKINMIRLLNFIDG